MSTKKKLLRNTVAISVGCGCRRPKIANIFRPKPKTKASSSSYKKPDLYPCSSSSWEKGGGGGGGGFSGYDDDEEQTTTTTTTFSSNSDSEYDLKNSKTVNGFGKVGESVAVVKNSDDPYLDFRHSMLQMILEKEIYAREDLRKLLDCFLQLNSPYHHEIIVQAFTEIWNGVFSVRPRRKSREF